MKDWLLPAGLALFCYGFWGFFPKLATPYLNSNSIVLYQNLGTLLVSVVILVFYPGPLQIHSKGMTFAALSGIAGVIGTFFFVLALSKGNAATITAITALYPLITLLMAVLFLHETLTLRQGIGFFMAVTAVFLIAF